MPPETPDPYEILGVASTATAAEIRAAYLTAVARYHPDKHAENPLADLATQKLATLNQAYELLSEPDRRARFDAGERDRGAPGQHRRPTTGHDRLLATLARAVGGLVLLVLVVRALPLLIRGLTAVGGHGGLWLGGALGMVLAVVVLLIARRRRRR
jgi:hypothetical protein